MQIFQRLHRHFGDQHWWPGDSPFEVLVGAVMTQNTQWTNVEKAILNLKRAELLTPRALHALDLTDLAERIRPAGTFRRKAHRLHNVLTWLCEDHDGSLASLTDIATDTLREELLCIKGVGPETADSILLYALDRPTFVVDTYTARVAVRHGLIEPPFDYHELQALFMDHLPLETPLFNEYHALLVAVGKNACKPRPRCENCPLGDLPRTLEFEGN
jgi:endonuclease-3 related protein